MIHIVAEGGEQLIAAMRSLGDQAPKVMAGALYREAEDILTDAKEHYVPVDQGHLRSVGFVEPPEVGPVTSVDLGFGGPYALAVHENPRAGHTGGLSPSGRPYKHWATVGEWKFLETPWKAAAPHMVEHLGESLDAAVTELGHG